MLEKENSIWIIFDYIIRHSLLRIYYREQLE